MNITSRSGGAVTNVAIIWIVFVTTRSALDVSLVGIAESLSTVLISLPAGVTVDRFDRRRLLLLSNLIRTICLIILVMLTTTIGFSLLPVVIIAAVISAAGELYRSSDYSVLPDLVSTPEIAKANGVNQAGYSLTGSVSNALAGALIVLAGVVFAFDYGAAGYAIAAIFSLFLLRKARSGAGATAGTLDRKKKGRAVQEISEGFRWLVTERGLLMLSLSATVFNFVLGIVATFLVVYVGEGLRAGAAIFGTILAVFVAGTAIGSILVSRTNAVRSAGKVWLGTNAGVGILALFLGLFPVVTVSMTSAFGIGLLIGFSNNVWLTSAQNLVPARMRGRYFAIDGLLSFVGGPPAIATGGILISVFGVLPVYELSGVLLIGFFALFSMAGSLRKLDGSALQNIVSGLV